MMINFDTSETGNNTIVKFGGWDESVITDVSDDYYAQEFPTVPGTWQILLPYKFGGILWMAPH